MSRWRRRCALLLLACSILSVGCAQGAPPPPPEPAPAAATPAQNNSEAESRGRRVIRTAELRAQDPEPASVRSRALSLVQARGGYLGGSETYGTGQIRLELKVPEAHFETVMAELRELPERVLGEQISTEDVTDQVVDLGARLEAQRAIETQLMAILARAETVEDALKVQTHLGAIRTEVERLVAQKQNLDHRTKTSTIQFHILPVPPVVARGEWGLLSSLTAAARDSVDVTVGVVTGSIRVLGFATPLLLMLGGPAWVLVRWYRRRREVVPQPPSSGPVTLVSR